MSAWWCPEWYQPSRCSFGSNQSLMQWHFSAHCQEEWWSLCDLREWFSGCMYVQHTVRIQEVLRGEQKFWFVSLTAQCTKSRHCIHLISYQKLVQVCLPLIGQDTICAAYWSSTPPWQVSSATLRYLKTHRQTSVFLPSIIKIIIEYNYAKLTDSVPAKLRTPILFLIN